MEKGKEEKRARERERKSEGERGDSRDWELKFQRWSAAVEGSGG